MTAVQHTSGKVVNRLSHIDMSSGDLLNKLEAVRLVCQETGCAQRYLTHDALNAIGQVSARIDDARGTTENTARFLNYLHRVQDQDLTLGVAMTDAKGDRSRRPLRARPTRTAMCTSSSATPCTTAGAAS
jgi:4-hydroxybutyryl-CoA dehydratase/vinylacetyl-CoA-Delta-isomerase